jgi:hypothetical protein
MTNTLDPAIVNEIIDKWLLGLTYREIEDETKIPKSSISNTIKRYLAKLTAADARAVRELAVLNRTKRIPLEDLAVLARTLNVLRRLGKAGAVEDLDPFFTGLASLTKKPLDKVATAIFDLIKIAETEGIPVSDVVARARQLLEQKKNAELKLASLDKEQVRVQHDIKNALLDKDMTMADIIELRTVRQELGSYGVDDMVKAISLVRTLAHSYNWDDKKVAKLLTAIQQLEASHRKLKNDIIELERRQAELQKKDKMYQIICKWPVTDELIESFWRKIEVIARAHNKDPRAVAVHALIDFVQKYDQYLGLWTAIARLEVLNSQLQNINKHTLIEGADIVAAKAQLQNEVDQLQIQKKKLQDDVGVLDVREHQLELDIIDSQDKIEQLDIEIDAKHKQIAAFNLRQATQLKIAGVTVMQSGTIHFGSGNTGPHS